VKEPIFKSTFADRKFRWFSEIYIQEV
jgi:hypothetical protein